MKNRATDKAFNSTIRHSSLIIEKNRNHQKTPSKETESDILEVVYGANSSSKSFEAKTLTSISKLSFSKDIVKKPDGDNKRKANKDKSSETSSCNFKEKCSSKNSSSNKKISS